MCAVTSRGARLGVAVSGRRARALPRGGPAGLVLGLAVLATRRSRSASLLASQPRYNCSGSPRHVTLPHSLLSCRLWLSPASALRLPRRRVCSITPSPLRLCTVAGRSHAAGPAAPCCARSRGCCRGLLASRRACSAPPPCLKGIACARSRVSLARSACAWVRSACPCTASLTSSASRQARSSRAHLPSPSFPP